jgi:hypothetical protein
MTLGQDQDFSFDNNAYPPKTGTGNSILKDADIVCQKILEFYSGVLQANLGARFNQECIACGMVNTNLQNFKDGYVVGSAICYPVPSTLKQTDYKFPLLSVYRGEETYLQMSTNHIVTEADFVITWTLPPLNDPNKMNHLYPFLSLVSKTLLFYTFEGNDPKFNSGELVWKEAGFAFALMEKARFGSFLGQDGKTIFPSVQINFKVFERNQFCPEDFETFTGFDGYISEVDGYNINNPYPDIVDFITNPGLNVNSIKPNSGTILGNTLVVIEGSGFSGIQISQQSQITIAGNAVLRWQVNSDTVIIAVTAYTNAPVVGPIVITDEFGNTATSTANFTYL